MHRIKHVDTKHQLHPVRAAVLFLDFAKCIVECKQDKECVWMQNISDSASNYAMVSAVIHFSATSAL
jgi:hypothetical protein